VRHAEPGSADGERPHPGCPCRHDDLAVDRRRHDGAAAVVDMLADQVDAAGGAKQPRRRRAAETRGEPGRSPLGDRLSPL
jgi:hypothetical protein